jgi:hypothetical protein
VVAGITAAGATGARPTARHTFIHIAGSASEKGVRNFRLATAAVGIGNERYVRFERGRRGSRFVGE